tara:strand:- start:2208 stop:3332 length:1125 start_codon:yes stop_codon:yes gene_type:complete
MRKKITVLDGGLSDKGTRVVIAVLKVKDAVDLFSSDIYAHERGRAGKGGYQRKPSETRIKQIANKIAAGYFIPGAMITCYRKPTSDDISFKDGVGQASIGDGDKLQWVDGQTRMNAYIKVYENAEEYGVDKDEFGNQTVFIVIFWGANIKEEANQFFDINQFAKAVPPGNRLELAAFLRDGEPTLEDRLVDLTWAIKDDPLWHDVITFPNQASKLLPNSGFITSLVKVFKSDNLIKIRESDRSMQKLLSAAWKGLQMVLPEAFRSKKDYSLQRAIGVNIIHNQIPMILFDIQMRNAEVFDKEKILDCFDPTVWESYWKKLTTFEDTNSEDKPVSGHEVFLRGAQGAVSKYSSAAGRIILSDNVSEHLGVGVRNE